MARNAIAEDKAPPRISLATKMAFLSAPAALLLIVVFIWIPACAFSGKAIKIADGDTITVLTPDLKKIRVRLYGIDCPEKGQPFGEAARRFTAGMVGNKEVEVEELGSDRYGRVVGIVGGLNQALIEAGLAWVYPRYCKAPLCGSWRILEREARAAKSGLWSAPSLPPWEWRRNKRQQGR